MTMDNPYDLVPPALFDEAVRLYKHAESATYMTSGGSTKTKTNKEREAQSREYLAVVRACWILSNYYESIYSWQCEVGRYAEKTPGGRRARARASLT